MPSVLVQWGLPSQEGILRKVLHVSPGTLGLVRSWDEESPDWLILVRPLCFHLGRGSRQSSLSSVLSVSRLFHMFPRLVPADVKGSSGYCSYMCRTCLAESCWSALLVNPLQEGTSDPGPLSLY